MWWNSVEIFLIYEIGFKSELIESIKLNWINFYLIQLSDKHIKSDGIPS